MLEMDLVLALLLNPGWHMAVDVEGGECVVRWRSLATMEEVNGNGPTLDAAMEILLVRMELSGRFEMPPHSEG